MNLDDLETVLDSQLGVIYHTVIINGTWGIGKSYFIDEYAKKSNSYKVSLFGINSIEDFKYAISYSINGLETNMNIIAAENESLSITLPFIHIPLPKIRKDFDSIIKSNLDNGKINNLIIDDIERKGDSLSLKDIFGIITQLTEIDKLNIILIINEDYIEKLEKEEKDIYIEFNEKTIERKYNIIKYSDNAINSICNELKYKKGIDSLKKIFILSRINNLRTLKKTIKFINLVFMNEKVKSIETEQMNKIITCSFNMMITITNKNFNSSESIVSQSKKIVYNNDINGKENEIYIIENLYNLYITSNYSYIDDIMQAFIVKEMNEPEKDLFYCSKEELLIRSKNFKKEVMEKYNRNYNINLLLKEIFKFTEYMKEYNCSEMFTKEEIENTIKLYVDNIELNYNDIYGIINSLSSSRLYTSKEMNEYAHTTIICKYLDYYIKKNIEEKDKYIISNIDNLFELITNNFLIKDINLYKDKIDIIVENSFFIPDINGSIDENIWGYTHEIFNKIHNLPNDNILKDIFTKQIRNMIDKSNDVGKHRLSSLMEQYNFQ